MTSAARYLAGLAAVSAATLALSRGLGPDARRALALALAAALGVQGPFGWWVIRSVGTPRLLPAWGLGIAARVALLGVMALVVVPALRWPAGPVLVSLVALLVALLGVEAVVVLLRTGEAEEG